jgi:hypothetical protein
MTKASVFLSKWWPTVITVIGFLATTGDPSIRGLLARYPEFAAAVLAIWAVINHTMPSPVSGGK